MIALMAAVELTWQPWQEALFKEMAKDAEDTHTLNCFEALVSRTQNMPPKCWKKRLMHPLSA